MRRKSILITGASSGIGRATAIAAVGAGWTVGLMARNAGALDQLAGELGEAALAVPGDVTSPEDLVRAADAVAERFDGLDAAFANAGTPLKGAPTDPDALRHLIDTNVLGVLFTARAVLEHLKKTQGHLVITGSAAGRRHIAGSIYGATKWFVHGYAGNMAEDMREWGGRCTVIAPGLVDTGFSDQPHPEKLHSDDVAAAVMHALEAPPRAGIREIFMMPQN